MKSGLVSVVVDDEIRWTREFAALPSGMTVRDRKQLLEVLALLTDALEQVSAQLQALETEIDP